MKIRTDFITNSSSSSFIIVVDESKFDYNEEKEILNQILSFNPIHSSRLKEISKEILNYEIDEYGYIEAITSGYFRNLNLKELEKEIESGKKIYAREIEYGCDFLINLLKVYQSAGKIKVYEEED